MRTTMVSWIAFLTHDHDPLQDELLYHWAHGTKCYSMALIKKRDAEHRAKQHRNQQATSQQDHWQKKRTKKQNNLRIFACCQHGDSLASSIEGRVTPPSLHCPCFSARINQLRRTQYYPPHLFSKKKARGCLLTADQRGHVTCGTNVSPFHLKKTNMLWPNKRTKLHILVALRQQRFIDGLHWSAHLLQFVQQIDF